MDVPYQLFTVNFDGFYDNETGIYGFTWMSGTHVGGNDVVSERDPHSHISHSKYWTYYGFAKGLHIPDGHYYVTVRALNNVVYGGALVTTIQHHRAIAVDTSPPVFSGVTDVWYDEDFDLLGIYFNASDDMSGLMTVDFGLGKTKHDVQIRGYSSHVAMDRKDPYVAVKGLGLQPGIPAWIRLRAENNGK